MNLSKFLLYPLGLLALSSGIVWAGQLTLTTYYPSPTGNYNTLYVQNNVGIGTTTPNTMFEAEFTGSGSGGAFRLDENIDYTLTTSAALGTLWGTSATADKGLSIAWNRESGSMDTNFVNLTPGSSSTGGFSFATWDGSNYNTLMAINGSNGNVGIGASSDGVEPSFPQALAPLEITNDTGTGTGVLLRLNSQHAGSGNGSSILFTNSSDVLNIASISGIASGSGGWGGELTFSTSPSTGSSPGGTPTERMRIDTNGNVGIGTTAPSYMLQVGTNSSATDVIGKIAIGSTTHGCVSPGGCREMILGYDGTYNFGLTDQGNGMQFGINYNAPAYSLYIDSNGNVGIGTDLPTQALQVAGNVLVTGTITAASDERLKKNIVPLADTLAKIDKLRGVSFEWRNLMGHKAGEKSIGMIAQELQKVYPELVVPFKSGNEQYLSIDYSKFTAVLLQSVKELKSQMNTMQDTINTLQERVKTLEKQK